MSENATAENIVSNLPFTSSEEISLVSEEQEPNVPADETEKLYLKNPQKFLLTQRDFSNCIIKFLQDNPFFVKISRYVRKIPTSQIETAGVMVHPKTHELIFYWNPEFISSLKPEELSAIIVHEFFHIIFHHVTVRKRTPHMMWNFGTDCANNSIILEMQASDNTRLKLPESCLAPGKRPVIDPNVFSQYSDKQKERINHLSDLIESFPKLMSSEYYFSRFMQDMAKNPDQYGDEQLFEAVFGSDDHSFWSNLSEEDREKIEEKIRQMVIAAQKNADSEQHGWGSIPQEIQAEIRRYASNIVNWKTILRQFVGTLIRAKKASSYKRINRKYPWVHPGKKTAYAARLLICVDQSGSVSDEMLSEFAAELPSLNKLVEFDYLPFDCSASVDDVKTFKRGNNFNINRTKTGGTDFNAPSDIVNNPENAGRWDGYLILTDGCAPEPSPSRVQRGWVLPKQCQLNFSTNELVIKIEENAQTTGAWR